MLAAILATRPEAPPPEPEPQIWQPGWGEITYRDVDRDGRATGWGRRSLWRGLKRRFPWGWPR